MLNRRSLLAAVPALALASQGALAQEGEESKLADLMGQINRNMRKLKKAGESEESLRAAVETVCALQGLALEAKAELPPLAAAEEDPAKRAAMVLDYRKTLQEMVVRLFAAENAALSGDKGAFAQAMSDVKRVQKKGHDAHKPQY